jgi:hypothetical protein
MQNNQSVRHLVIFKFQPGTTPSQVDQLTQEFRSLKDRIPGILDFEYGTNNSPEGLNQDFTHIYMLTFESQEARDTYLPHPEHQKFGEFAGSLGIIAGVFVVDYSPQPLPVS